MGFRSTQVTLGILQQSLRPSRYLVNSVNYYVSKNQEENNQLNFSSAWFKHNSTGELFVLIISLYSIAYLCLHADFL